MKILFLCTSNVHRSRTAEDLFAKRYTQHQFKSAGLSAKYCAKEGSTLCTEEFLSWADKVYVFEKMHIDRIVESVGHQFEDKTFILNIDDIYGYMDESLCKLLINKLNINDFSGDNE